MKSMFIYFILGCCLGSVVFAAEDNCAKNCSLVCQNEVRAAEAALKSHKDVCRGKEAPIESAECAQSCSRGCKAFMRGQESILVEHYELCGGGSGLLGRLYCLKLQGGYKVVNSHTGLFIGQDYTFESECLRAVNTQEENVFCGKTHGGYNVFSILGDPIGKSLSFLNQCVESLLTVKNHRICVKESLRDYAIYELDTFKRVRSGYSFLNACQRDL